MGRFFRAGLVVIVTMATLTVVPAYAGGLSKASSKNPEAQKLIDKAWGLEHTDSNAEIYRQCASLLEEADKLDPNNPAILIELARYYWNYGDQLPKQTPEQRKILMGIYAQGMDAAEKSLKLKESVGAHYWFAVNKAAGLEFASVFAQAAAFPSIYKHSDYVTNHDPSYYYGSNGRLWSEILARVPRKAVELVHWNVQAVVDEIDKSIKIEPRYLDNYVFKARFIYVYFGKKEETLKLLDYVLKQDPNVFPEEVTANKVAQRKARELWKKITGKEYPQK